jgi:serine/threonine-protein kinase
MPLSPSANLGHYEVLSQQGAGGMGEVYLAHDTRLKRRVALKVLPADLTNNREHLRRFEQEARAASSLNHPNIITIYEIGAEGDTHFIATEFIEGETVRSKSQTAQLEITETLNIAIQIAAALDAAHRSNIVHRDIKPENVMVRADGVVKVLDFGLAKLTEPQDNAPADTQALTQARVKTNPGVVMGTVAYMSPEQARGLEVDTRTDIFSLGVVLYEMLTTRLPFEGATASDYVAEILKSEPAPPSQLNPEVSAELERIVGKTLRKDREERYQTAKDLLVDLRQLKKQIELERTASANRTQHESATQISAARPTASAASIAGARRTTKFGFVVAGSVLLLAVVGLGYWFFASRSTNPAQIESIAVMPFVNESGNPDVEYLSDGMTESLINSLSQLPHLVVKARSSVFRYKGKEVEPQQVAAALSVQAILIGRVVERGDDLTLYLSLVDARNGNQLWGEQYNRKLTDLTSLQSKIAHDVSLKLRARLSGTDVQNLAKNYTANSEAYQLYLKGRYYWNKRTEEGLRKGIEYFQQAIDVDPNYALAYSGLADCYISFGFAFDFGSLPPNEAIPKAKAEAMKALEIDDTLAEAHTSLAYAKQLYDWDWSGSEREFKRALELNPNYANAHHWYSHYLIAVGRNEESLAESKRALELDPLSLIINTHLGWYYIYAHQYDLAIEQLHKTLELDPNYGLTHWYLGLAYEQKRMYPEATAEFSEAMELLKGNLMVKADLGHCYAVSGKRDEAQKIMAELQELSKQRYVSSFEIALIYTGLGEKEQAFDWLGKAYQEQSDMLVYLKVEPRLDPLSGDPRFRDLLRHVGLMP